ncbi:uncharacterized protein LOC119674822 [Teleopsis dalmanni]|uniref:uncharacterized protein LOC119674822 n=1 Tax=Teleopsis dalmanni TaxID=139649 RepID=UPI0018CD31BA|nr:uncharacterized protein LOC119674822 [Teleopsis dalmanni]
MENSTDILRTPFGEDLPRAFSYSTASSEDTHYCGPYVQTILHFASYRNYQLKLINNDIFNISRTLLKIEAGEYNLSLHGVSYTRPNTIVQYSYPVEISKKCIMVPLEDELPKFWHIVWPFDRYIWLVCFFSIFYIAVLMCFIEHPVRTVTNDVARNLSYSLAILLYCSNMNIRIKNITARVFTFYTLLFSLGFILNAYYFPYITAYNMKPIFTTPINTVEELLQSNTEILLPPEYHNDVDDYKYQKNLKPLGELFTRRVFKVRLEYLNRSVAYVLLQDKWKFVDMQQVTLKKPYFHLTPLCFGVCFKSYPVSLNSSFLHSLNRFVLKVKEAGLWQKWEWDAFLIARRAKYASIVLDSYPLQPLKIARLYPTPHLLKNNQKAVYDYHRLECK